MRVLGLVFAGTSTEARETMTAFLERTMGLERAQVAGVEADLFRLPDGSHVAVASPGGMGATERSIGFLVEDLDEAIGTLSRVGVSTGAVNHNAVERYTHFRAPDGHLYELIERTTRGRSG
jgi:catechol 2,3-dioxygenase-like lactoylglutathione lyase family enzyme